jgi:hypothetical protein
VLFHNAKRSLVCDTETRSLWENQRKRFDPIIYIGATGIWVCVILKHVSTWNEEYEQLFGWKKQAINVSGEMQEQYKSVTARQHSDSSLASLGFQHYRTLSRFCALPIITPTVTELFAKVQINVSLRRVTSGLSSRVKRRLLCGASNGCFANIFRDF